MFPTCRQKWNIHTRTLHASLAVFDKSNKWLLTPEVKTQRRTRQNCHVTHAFLIYYSAIQSDKRIKCYHIGHNHVYTQSVSKMSDQIFKCFPQQNKKEMFTSTVHPWTVFEVQNNNLLTESYRFLFAGTLKKPSVRGRSIKIRNFFFNLLLYLQLNQTCLLQRTPLHSWYTVPNVFSQFCNASSNVFCGMTLGFLIEFSSISSTVWNWRPFSEDFNFGNKKKSAGVKSGE